MKSILAVAIINKKKPRLNIREIYSIKDGKSVKINKDEKIVKVKIKVI